MRASRIGVIARFEYLTTVKRLSFLLTTLGLPLLLASVTVASALFQAQLVAPTLDGVPLGVVVAPESLLPADTALGAGLRRAPTEAEALRQLETHAIDHVFVVADDWRETGVVRHVSRGNTSPFVDDDVALARTLAGALRRAVLRGVVDESVARRVDEPVRLRNEHLRGGALSAASEQDLADAIGAVMVPMMLAVLMLSALLMASGYLVQTIATDKETRIVEILLSSATPDELLAGKLLGLGGAGLTQFACFATLGALASATATEQLGFTPNPPIEALIAAPISFLLGYTLLGSLTLALSALGTSAAESQKLTIGVVLLAILPLLAFPAMLEHPHGTLSRALSYFPLTAPLAIVIRLAVDPVGVAWFELPLVALVVLLSIALSLRLGARLFRVGLLLTGAIPDLGELVRQARR